jgi:organic hydroperoxide reductase OsmC/OhrA
MRLLLLQHVHGADQLFVSGLGACMKVKFKAVCVKEREAVNRQR